MEHREGACECCQFEPVKVYPFDDEREHRQYNRHTGITETNPAGEEKIWLCQLCAAGWAGNSVQYPEQYDNAKTLQTICKTANKVLAELDKKEGFDQTELTDWLKAEIEVMFEE
jgi:hypothetical protein